MLYKGIETLHTFYDDYSSSTVNCALEKKYWGVASASSPLSKECCPCVARVEEQWICWAFGKPIHHGHYTRSTICMVSRSSSNKFLLAIHFARRHSSLRNLSMRSSNKKQTIYDFTSSAKTPDSQGQCSSGRCTQTRKIWTSNGPEPRKKLEGTTRHETPWAMEIGLNGDSLQGSKS